MTYDLWFTTHHSWLSHPTIIHDHHSWPSGLITWLLTHDFSPMAIKVFSTMTMTYHRWFSLPWPSSMSMSSSLTTTISHLWLLTQRPWPPYDHEVSSMTIRTLTHDHQDTHPWPSEWSPMSTLCLSCGQLTWTIRGVSMMSTVLDTSTLIDSSIVHGESMRECERMRVWYPLIKMTEMIEMIETTKEGQKRFWWYFLNIVCFLVFLCIVVWVWVVSGVFVVCVLVLLGDWYKRCWVGKWVAPAILGD